MLNSTVRVLALLLLLIGSPIQAIAQNTSALSAVLSSAQRQLAGQAPHLLAAEASQEGHWTFLNQAGERYTAATPEEMKRVLPTLLPNASASSAARITLAVSDDTVFRYRPALLSLALAQEARTDPFVAVGDSLYRLVRRGDALYAAVRPGLLVEIGARNLFDETVWQLSHPLKRGSVRILAVEPGGPTSLPASPRMDTETRRPLTDQIAPASLVPALRALRAETVVLTARRDGALLAFRPASGPELSIDAAEIMSAAQAADVNLVVLQSATPRQPGTRSWLWQRVSVTRLDDAVARDHLADFLNALATPEQRLLVSAAETAPGRIRLTASPLRGESGARGAITETWNDVVSSIAGQVVVTGVEAVLRDRTRQTELDRRILPWLPSWVQLGYGALLALGFLGHSTGRRWWTSIWPPEARDNYDGPFGFLAAQGIRNLLYIAFFMPFAGPLSFAATLLGLARRPAAAA